MLEINDAEGPPGRFSVLGASEGEVRPNCNHVRPPWMRLRISWASRFTIPLRARASSE